MHLEKNGNYEITDIKFLKKQIVLVLDDQELKISETTYSHFYLYKGRKLSQEELDQIVEFQSKAKIKDYAFNLLSKGLYSRKQVEEKLAKRKADKKTINELISELVENGYINDSSYLNEKVEIMNRKNIGKNKIILTLKQDGIDNNLISSIEFDDEEVKAMACFNKFILSHKEYNRNQLKQGGYRYLLSNGFDGDICLKIIEENLTDFDIDEGILLEKVLNKYILLHHLDINDVEQRQKVVSYLLRKGYHYEDINDVIRRIKK